MGARRETISDVDPISSRIHAQALQAFVAEHPHVDIMSAIAPDMGRTRFVRWQVQGSALPPPWSEALRRIEDA